jgi:F-type H+-transporting ATPase subunit b
MTIDFWGLGLQAVNVLILIWLLSRVFWRPVAAAIAKRQRSAQAVMTEARAARTAAEAALADAARARGGMADERAALLDAARAEAQSATTAALAKAKDEAEAMLAAAKTAIAHDAEAADAGNAAKASELSLTIAATLLGRLNGPAVQAAFLSQLIDAIAQLPATDLKALRGDPDGIDIIAASAAGERRGAIERAVRTALGGDAKLRFAVDPDLLAGLELRGAHFALRNSWQADLMQIRKAVQDAA